MKPVNTKSLFHHLCNTMDKLDNAEIDVATASAQAKLVSQCTNLLNYELKRAVILSNDTLRSNLRNLESKTFDSLPE